MSNYISKVTASLQTINCKSECLNLCTEREEQPRASDNLIKWICCACGHCLSDNGTLSNECMRDGMSVYHHYCPRTATVITLNTLLSVLWWLPKKNAWMNSTLKAILNKWFYRSVVLPRNYLRRCGALNSFNGPWPSVWACIYRRQHDCVIIPTQ